MLNSIIFLGVFSIAAILASSAILNTEVSSESRYEGWNELLRCAGLFNENLNTIQVKSEVNEVVLEQLKDLLSQDATLDNVYTNYRKTFKKLNSAAHPNKDIFKAQLYSIAAHNLEANSGKHSWWMAVNQFTDMSLNDMRQMTVDDNRKSTNYTNKPYIFESQVALPATKNWVDEGKVSAVRDSNGGASGAYFAVAAAVDSANTITMNHNKPYAGSVQQLVDCVPLICKSQFAYLCQGSQSQVETNLKVITITNLALWNNYPYNNPPSVGSCDNTKPIYAQLDTNNPFQVYGPNNDVALMQLLVQRGPLVLGLYFSDEMTRSYGEGVYPGSDCGNNAPNQDVVLVGYGTENGQDYWLIKNSWGRYWGNQGYLKLARNGNNNCQVLQTAIAVQHRRYSF